MGTSLQARSDGGCGLLLYDASTLPCWLDGNGIFLIIQRVQYRGFWNQNMDLGMVHGMHIWGNQHRSLDSEKEFSWQNEYVGMVWTKDLAGEIKSHFERIDGVFTFPCNYCTHRYTIEHHKLALVKDMWHRNRWNLLHMNDMTIEDRRQMNAHEIILRWHFQCLQKKTQ